MSTDYIILAIVAALGCCGGLFLLSQAKEYRRNEKKRKD